MNTRSKGTSGPQEDWGVHTDLVYMCLPPAAMAVFFYGLRPALLCATAVITANLCDRVVALLRGQKYEKDEWSSEAFAFILALLLPATASYYMVVVGTLAAVLVGKEAFGGYGAYPFHPVAVGYAVVAVSWPTRMFAYPDVSLFNALPLGSVAEVSLVESPSHMLREGGLPTIDTVDLVLGNYAGPMGTTVLLVILACALFLIHRRRMGLVAPLCFIFACAFMAFFFPRLGDLAFAAPWEHLLERLDVVKYEICTGGVLFAAVFLINDPVTLPKSTASRAVYGLVLGVATMLFRYYGTYETGVCFALLAVGAVSGWMDRAVQRAIHHKGVVRREY